MIMAELSSPALDRAGGVWAGMSGSPVYAEDGRLMGAVAYGLAWNSKIAGITPAESMMELLGTGANPPLVDQATMPEQIPAVATDGAVLRANGATAEQAGGGFHRLTLPVWLSGVGGDGANKLIERMSSKMTGARVMAGGAATTGEAGDVTAIFAGSNFAAALSYGDLTFAGTGTTTFVCNGRAVAFGHPFFNAGAVQMTAHASDALFVQPDPLFGPFKVANAGGVVGVVDGDRRSGITAELGAQPANTTLITSTLGLEGATPIVGTTTAVYQPWLADIAAFHTLYNIDRVLNSGGAGSVAYTLTVEGTRADGTPFTASRTDVASSEFEIDFEVAIGIYINLVDMVYQPFEDAKITKVNITGTVSPVVNSFRVTSLKVRQGGAYVDPAGGIAAVAGTTLKVRAQLTPYRGIGSPEVVTLDLAIPESAAGTTANLLIHSVSQGFFGEEGPSKVMSFDDVLDKFSNGPGARNLVATLELGGGDGPVPPVGGPATAVEAVAVSSGAISQYNASFMVEVS